MGTFLDETTTRREASAVTLRELYATYSTWCKQGNEYPLRTPQFVQEMRRRGFAVNRSESERQQVVEGLALRGMQLSATGVVWQ
jgi:phage/plasmid-associated DNA primase